MRIFNSPTGDPMLLDTRTGLRELQARFKAFVASPVDTASFAAETTGSPAPYDEFVGGLRVQKRSGEASLILAADRWLELSASTDSHTSTRSTRGYRPPSPSTETHWPVLSSPGPRFA